MCRNNRRPAAASIKGTAWRNFSVWPFAAVGFFSGSTMEKCVHTPCTSKPGSRQTSAACAVSAGQTNPSRPMPVSSFTWTPNRPPASSAAADKARPWSAETTTGVIRSRSIRGTSPASAAPSTRISLACGAAARTTAASATYATAKRATPAPPNEAATAAKPCP